MSGKDIVYFVTIKVTFYFVVKRRLRSSPWLLQKENQSWLSQPIFPPNASTLYHG